MRPNAFKIIIAGLVGLLLASCGGGGDHGIAASPGPFVQAKAKSPAQDPTLVAGPVSVVNGTIDGAQVLRAIGATSDGGYTVAWVSGGSALYMQHYDSAGMKEGGETLVAALAPPASSTQYGSLAVLTDGSVVVGYQISRSVPIPEEWPPFSRFAVVSIQRFDASGAAVLPHTEVAATHVCASRCIVSVGGPYVYALADGGFVVSWTELGDSGTYGSSPGTANVFLQRYDMQAQPVGPQRLAGGGAFFGYHGISPDARGGFTVKMSWVTNPRWGFSPGDTFRTHFDAKMNGQSIDGPGLLLPLEGGYVLFSAGANGAFRQMLDTAATPVGEPAAISSVPVQAHELSDGSYVAVWADGTEFTAQRFTAAGATLGRTVGIHIDAASFQLAPLADPGFALGWTADGGNGDSDVFTQRYFENAKAGKKACLDAAKAQRLKGKERKAFIDACVAAS